MAVNRNGKNTGTCGPQTDIRRSVPRELIRKVQEFIDAEWIAPDDFECGVYAAPDGSAVFASEAYSFQEEDLSLFEISPDDFEEEAPDIRPPAKRLKKELFRAERRSSAPEEAEAAMLSDSFAAPSRKGNIDDIMGPLGQTFQEKLLATIDSKGLRDPDVYRRANIDRRLFSRIRSNKNYKPSKPTALAFAIALGLDLDETTDLLQRAGLALSPSSRADLIVKYCILNEIYDIFDVNALLYEYDQPLLGC